MFSVLRKLFIIVIIIILNLSVFSINVSVSIYTEGGGWICSNLLQLTVSFLMIY